MKDDHRWQILLTWVLVTVVFACAGASGGNSYGKKLPVTVIAEGRHCLPVSESWAATWIASRDPLHDFVSRCRSQKLGFNPTLSMDVDFDRYRVVALEMGQQSSAGYGFDTKRVAAFLQSGNVVVSVTWYQPGPGVVSAQMLTSPWILIRLPIGSYRSIRVMDQNDRQLVRMASNLQ